MSFLSAVRGRTLLALFAAICVVLLASTPRSAAAEIDAIDPGSIIFTRCDGDGDVSQCETTDEDGATEVDQYDSVRVDMDWSAPADAKAGDTFSITLSSPFSLLSGSFDLETAGGDVAGTCVAQGAQKTVTCTLTDFVETHEDVHGSLWITAQARETSDAGTTDVTLGSSTTVEVPAPRVVPVGEKLDGTTRKGGWVVYPATSDGTVRLFWDVAVEGDEFGDASTLTLTDTLTGDHAFVDDQLGLEVLYGAVGSDLADAQVLDSSAYSVDTTGSTLSVTLPNLHENGMVPAGTDYEYRVRYHTVPGDTTTIEPGTTWGNAVTGTQQPVQHELTYDVAGDGTAVGTVPETPTPPPSETPTPSDSPSPSDSPTPSDSPSPSNSTPPSTSPSTGSPSTSAAPPAPSTTTAGPGRTTTPTTGGSTAAPSTTATTSAPGASVHTGGQSGPGVLWLIAGGVLVLAGIGLLGTAIRSRQGRDLR